MKQASAKARAAKPLPVRTKRLREVQRRQEAFIAAFVVSGNISKSCQRARVGRETVRIWRRDDPAFAALFDAQKIVLIDLLEEAGMTKALKPNGALMNIFMLKALDPEKYRDNVKVEHSGGVTVKSLLLEDDKK